jgi:hypothetical protein
LRPVADDAAVVTKPSLAVLDRLPGHEDSTMPKQLLNTRAAADYLTARGVPRSIRTLQLLRSRGGGPRYIRVSQIEVVYDPADLDAWIAEKTANRFRSTAEEIGAVAAA